MKNGKFVTVTVPTRAVVYVDEDVIIPTKVRKVADWNPVRHGILLNEYIKWIEQCRGNKRDFVVYMVKAIADGEFPLLRKTALDKKPNEPWTEDALESQLDWLADKENKVIMSEENSTQKIFNPTNLLIMTCTKKSAEAQRSRQNKKAQAESEAVQLTSQDALDELESEPSSGKEMVSISKEVALQLANLLQQVAS